MITEKRHFKRLAIVTMCVAAAWPVAGARSAAGVKQSDLIDVLKSGAPKSEKAMACKRLAIYGNEESVPALAPLLASKLLGLMLIQVLLAGQVPEFNAFIGALIVLAFYALVGGRVFCSWVCPVNMVTDLAAWFRRRFGIKSSGNLSRDTRYWALGLVLLLALATGTLVWELFNPVSMLHRGLIFGMGMAWLVLLGIFLFDLLIARQGWCGHVCPVGAFYGLLGSRSLVRVGAFRREKCDDCMDCFEVCPEPQVIRSALKGADKGEGPVILDSNCTNCGRCIDVCHVSVFRFGGRTETTSESGAGHDSGTHYSKTIKDSM